MHVAPLRLTAGTLLRRPRRRGRSRGDGGGTRLGRECPVEAHPAEHVHAMGQRTFEDYRSDDSEFGDRSLRRITAGGIDRGAVAETDAQTQQETDFPEPEAGECLRSPEVLRRRRHQDH